MPFIDMRIFVYLLALMSGFSAAHAAGDNARAPAAVDMAEAVADFCSGDTAVAGAQGGYAAHQEIEARTDISALSHDASLAVPAAPRSYRCDRVLE